MLCINVYTKPGARVLPPLPHLFAFALQWKYNNKRGGQKALQQPVSHGKHAFDLYASIAQYLN